MNLLESGKFFLVASAAVALCSCGQSSVDESKTDAGKSSVAVEKSGPRKVVVAKVISQQLSRDLRLPADLLAYRDVAIYPKVNGFVEWIGVDRGSQVKKGQQLVRMSAPELSAQSKEGNEAARAALDQKTQAKEEFDVVTQQLLAAQAKAKASSDTYQRLKDASSYPGIIAGNDLELAQKTAEADAAFVHSLERKCEALKSQEKAALSKHEAAVQSAKSTTTVESYLNLAAPFDGVITERNVHEGSFVHPPAAENASAPLLRLKQLSVLRLVVPVPEIDLSGILTGAEVKFSVTALPGEDFKGVVRRIGNSVDVATRTMPVELDVNNNSNRLSPGMFAEVNWPVKRQRATLFVPQTALVKTTERSFVIRIKNNTAEWVDVKPGVTADDKVEVFGNLTPADDVVLRATDEIRDGSPVDVH